MFVMTARQSVLICALALAIPAPGRRLRPEFPEAVIGN
jgi:hypothetical protein